MPPPQHHMNNGAKPTTTTTRPLLKKDKSKKVRDIDRQRGRGRSSSPKKKTSKAQLRNDQLPLFGLTASTIWTMLFVLLFTLMISISFVTKVNPFLFFPIIYLGSISMPMQTLIGISILFLFEVATLSETFVLLVLLSMSIGTCLLIGSRFTPFLAVRATGTAALYISKVYHFLFQNVIPNVIQRIVGVVFTLVSELLLSPAIIILLFGVAQLKFAGEDFNTRMHHAIKRKDRVAIVLIHGNAFNECQWLFGRLYLMNQPYREELEFFSVNIFSGPMLRYHTHGRTTKIEQCAKLAFEEIQEQFKAKGRLPPQTIILMGHSLGGVVAAYIKEFLAPEYNAAITDNRERLNIPRVITWSAPLAGSALLHWAKVNLPSSVTFYRAGINNEFCPTNEVTISLRQKMEATEKLQPSTYFTISGDCDPLVRADSALPRFLPDKNRIRIPYLGHYNIKVSLQAWSHVAMFLAEYFKEMEERAA
jgi:hypothetical protein